MRLGPKLSLRREAIFALLAVSFFVAVPLFLFWPALLFHRVLYGFDTMTLTIPFNAEVRQSLAAHQWPLWMPDVLGGMPCIASCNVQFLYPTDLIGCFSGLSLPAIDALDAVVHVALAGIGMFLFLRRLDRGISAALLGGFFFAVSGSVVSQLFGGYYGFLEGVALVPWAFWAAHKGRTEGSLFAWGLCGLIFSLQILAQATQTFVYTLPAVAAFVLIPRETRFSAVRGMGLAVALAFLLAAPQIWPTLQYLPLSARHGYTHAQFIAGSIGLSEAMNWVVPGFFGWRIPSYHGPMGPLCVTEYFGLLPWALAGGAVFALWRREAGVRWMAGLALAAFFFAQRRWTPFYAPFSRLPLVSGFRIWSRILFLLTFAVCTLAAFGWDALRTAPHRKAALRGVAVFSALALAAAALAWGLAPGQAAADAPRMGWFAGSLDGAGRTAEILTALARRSALTTLALVPVLAVLLWFGTRRLGTVTALVLALAFHVQDQKSVFKRFVNFMDPQQAVDPSNFKLAPPGLEPWRVFDDNAALPNRALLHGYENLGGLESVPLQSSMRIMASMERRKKDWLDLMNVRYVFGPPKPGSGDAATVYANPGAFHRAWLVAKIRAVSGDEEAYGLLADPGFNPLDEVALDAGPGTDPEPGAASSSPKDWVRWLSRSPQTCSLDVSTDKAAVLVLSNAWYPSWKASVDGRRTPVLKADGGLQAVMLPAGRHQVDFSFDNGLFDDAVAACLAGLVFLFGLSRIDAQSKRPKSGDSHAPHP